MPAMLKSHPREKLIETVLFFASACRECDKRKLTGLLYLLDVSHFAQTGLSVTGLDYAAWERGPVPINLADELDDPRPDLAAAIGHSWDRPHGHIRALRDPCLDWFTKRELSLMIGLVHEFGEGGTERIEHATQQGPWALVWNDGLGSGWPIDYALAIPAESPDREELLATARELALMMPALKQRAVRVRDIA